MRLHLLAPFRTQFQIDTEFCLSDWERASDLIHRTVSPANTKHGFVLSGPARMRGSGFVKYTTLDSDHLSPFSTPLLTFDAPPDLRERLAAQFFGEFSALLGPAAKPHLGALNIVVYDNTIAMLQVEVGFAADGVDGAEFISRADDIVSSACSRLISEMAVGEVEALVETLVAALEASSERQFARHVVRRPRDFLAFDDVAFGGTYGWPKDHPPMLWVNRTLEIESGEADFLPIAARWARLNGEAESELAQPVIERAQVGNSLFFNSASVPDYLEALRVIQYFYIIFDIFSDRLKRFYVDIAPWRDARSVGGIQKRASRISSFFGFARSEFGDMLVGLQSERKAFARQIATAYDLDAIIGLVEQKNQGVDTKLHALIEMRGQARQKVLQFGVVLIGALQIFDLLLNVSWFARTEPQIVAPDIPGLLTLGLAVSPNLLQTVAFLAVLVVAVLIVGRRRL